MRLREKTKAKRKLAVIVTLLQLLSNSIFPVWAADIQVNSFQDVPNGNNNTNNDCRLREAVESVNAGADLNGCVKTGPAYGVNDKITFSANGTYQVNNSAISVKKDVIIQGSGTAGSSTTAPNPNITIQGKATGNNTNNIFNVGNPGNDTTLDIRNVRLKNGKSSSGGLVFLQNGNSNQKILKVTDSVLENGNSNTEGGAIEANQSNTVEITRSAIINSTAASSGGAINVDQNSSITIDDSRITGNSASSKGGAINIKNGNATITNSVIDDNTAAGNGGGINLDSGAATLNLSDSVMTNNVTTGGSGGAINVNVGTLNIDDSEFGDLAGNSNMANSGSGGAINIAPTAVTSSTITNSKFRRNKAANGGAINSALTGGNVLTIDGNQTDFQLNTATQRGGAIHLTDGSNVDISDALFQDNSAVLGGGAIYFNSTVLTPGTLDLVNTNFTGNFASNASSIGGAINATCTSLTVTGEVSGGPRALFDSNTSSDEGGAIFAKADTIIIDNADFLGNWTGNNGGGISLRGGFNVATNNTSIQDSDFTDNIATSGGGGAIWCSEISGALCNLIIDGSSQAYGFLQNKAAFGGAIGSNIAATSAQHSLQLSGVFFNQNEATAGNGGAVAMNLDTADIDDVDFNGNTATGDSGALQLGDVSEGDIDVDFVLNNIVFDNNHADQDFGAAQLISYGNDVSATLNNCTFNNNSAGGMTGGLGLYSPNNQPLDLVQNNCIFTGNSDATGGAALNNQTSGAVTIDQSTFQNNTSSSFTFPGTIIAYGVLIISNSAIVQNNGPALYINDSIGAIASEIINTTIGENSYSAGPAIQIDSPTDITSTTIYSNFLNGSYPAILINSTVNIANTIISGNGSGVAPACTSGLNTLNSLGYNLFDPLTGCVNYIPGPGDIIGLSPILSSLGLHGGTTPNYIYANNSPGLDQGSTALAPGTDQRGVSRPQGLNTDIGATDISDTFKPNLSVVTPVPTPSTNTSPSYTFYSDEPGPLSCTGTCCTGPYPDAVMGNNTITFSSLSTGSYVGCFINVTDASSNVSDPLVINTFTINGAGALTEVTPVPPYTSDSTPDYTFNSTIADTIIYGGDCVSSTSAAVIGNNTITFDTPLSEALHSNCTLTLQGGSNILNVSPFTVDQTSPTVVLASTPVDGSTTNVSPFNLTANFSETVIGFNSFDITAVNGTVSNFAGGGSSYSFDVTPSGSGLVTVNINAGQATDQAGNNNLASNTINITFDNTQPTLTLSTTATDPTSQTPIPVTANFSESISGFSDTDIIVTNGTVGNFVETVAGLTYTFDVTPTAVGIVTINVNAAQAFDNAGNGNSASNILSLVFDNDNPSVGLTTTSASPTNSGNLPFTATFSEQVNGFGLGNINVINGTATNLNVLSLNKIFTFDVIPGSAGTVTVKIDAGEVNDNAGNANTDSNTINIIYDNIAPASVNLSPLTATIDSVTLAWGAPGDDGNFGQATSYDIRYSTSSINTGNFNTLDQADNIPVPATAGSSESITISGLLPGVTYYFALVATDDVGNTSVLSNVATAMTTSISGGGSGGGGSGGSGSSGGDSGGGDTGGGDTGGGDTGGDTGGGDTTPTGDGGPSTPGDSGPTPTDTGSPNTPSDSPSPTPTPSTPSNNAPSAAVTSPSTTDDGGRNETEPVVIEEKPVSKFIEILIEEEAPTALPESAKVIVSNSCDRNNFTQRYGVEANQSTDHDGDGLSDYYECRIGTNPLVLDTDGDGYGDGLEVLQLLTNPLVPNSFGTGLIKITTPEDKQKTVDTTPLVIGIAPANQTVRIYLLKKENFALFEENLRKTIDAREDLSDEEKLILYKKEFANYVSEIIRLNNSNVLDPNDLEYSRYINNVFLLGQVISDSENNFLLDSDKDIRDDDYLLVAESNGNYSEPVEFILDQTLNVDKPLLDTLDQQKIPAAALIGNLRVEVSPGTRSPVLVGRITEASRIVATWQSQVLASALIADSVTEEFRLSSPRPLEPGEHKVLVTAYRIADGAQSETITLKFRINEKATTEGINIWHWLIPVILLTAILIFMVSKRKKQAPVAAPITVEPTPSKDMMKEIFGENADKMLQSSGEAQSPAPTQPAKVSRAEYDQVKTVRSASTAGGATMENEAKTLADRMATPVVLTSVSSTMDVPEESKALPVEQKPAEDMSGSGAVTGDSSTTAAEIKPQNTEESADAGKPDSNANQQK